MSKAQKLNNNCVICGADVRDFGEWIEVKFVEDTENDMLKLTHTNKFCSETHFYEWVDKQKSGYYERNPLRK